MDKIVFKISNNHLSVNLLLKDTPKEDLNKTNIIDTKELVFTLDYINKNLDLVSSFLNVIIIKRNVTKVTIKDFSIVPSTLDIINVIPNIKDLIIKPDEKITYEIFLKLLDNKYLENIEVYDFPNYLLSRYDINKKAVIKIRSEIFFISNFMKINNLNTYSDIYYKKSIIIKVPFDNNDINDFNTFIGINKYLREIVFDGFDSNIFNHIMTALLQKNISNLRLQFTEKELNKDSMIQISNFKKKYEDILKENNINFKVKYSEEYKKNNFLKQLNLNFIKISLVAVILVVIFMIGINYYRNYVDEQNYLNIENDLKELLLNSYRPIEEGSEPEYIEPLDEDLTTTTTTTVYDIEYEKVFSSLFDINKDTVGWLTVNNTRIDYPVVQGPDNDYYLNKDYYNNKNRHGWIYMDYRNNPEELDENTLIYGHNLANQSMFGTLRYVLNPSWYQKSKNQIITFNTPYGNMKWQIFSIYVIPVTNDYLEVTFANSAHYQNFLNMITERSIYNFNVPVSTDDKILSLSTCSDGSKKRLVVHAKLIV